MSVYEFILAYWQCILCSQCSVVNSYHFHRLVVLMMVRPTRQSTDSINFLQILSFPPIIYHFEHGDFCFLVRHILVGAWWLECSFYMHVRISREPSPVRTVIDHKQLENVEYFNCLRSTITNDAKCTREIKSRIAMPKSAFKSKKTFHQQIGLRFREETSDVLHLRRSILWCWNVNTSEIRWEIPGAFAEGRKRLAGPIGEKGGSR